MAFSEVAEFLCHQVVLFACCPGLRERRKLAYAGQVTVAMAVHGKKGELVSGPDVRSMGVAEDRSFSLDEFLDALADEGVAAGQQLEVQVPVLLPEAPVRLHPCLS